MRRITPMLARVTFVLSGTFHPKDLIRNPDISPFNVGERLRLLDFEIGQVEKLIAPLGVSAETAQRIRYWTAGQPFLTQSVADRLCRQSTPHTIEQVDQTVQRLMREDDKHLPPVLSRLADKPKLAAYAQRIRREHIGYFPNINRRQRELTLLGLITSNAAGNCIIRNRIYDALLDAFE